VTEHLVTEPRWLDSDERRAWLGLVVMMTSFEAALDQQLRQDSGISHATYLVLAALSRAPGETLRMSDLAEMTHGSQSRLSHSVARLEEQELVERTRPEADKRIVHATLTEGGRALLRAAAPGHVAQVRRVLIDRLSPEQLRQLTEITQVTLRGLADAGFTPRGWPLTEAAS
jgi:DNA-binding MarR family transcriptional regulator